MKVLPTQIEQIPLITEMEQAALPWVCPYSTEKHEALIRDTSSFHAIAWNDQNQPVGLLILEGLNHPHRSVLLRRIVANPPQRGIGSALLRWAMHCAFERHGAHRLWLEVFADNLAAIRLYEKAGMTREGIWRECMFQQGRWRSLYFYSILDREYRQKIAQ